MCATPRVQFREFPWASFAERFYYVRVLRVGSLPKEGLRGTPNRAGDLAKLGRVVVGCAYHEERKPGPRLASLVRP